MAKPAEGGDLAEQVALLVLGSAKYRHLDEAFVRRVSGEAVLRCRDRAEAVKYAKRKLHQAFGAFVGTSPGDAVRRCVQTLAAGGDLRDACRTAMRAHASTAERLPFLEELAAQIEAWCGRPSSVVDLACGLNPLAIPWLRLEPGARYWCCDVDVDLVAALPGLGALLDVQLRAETRDLAASPSARAPVPAADLGLVLKAVTTLEQQRPGAARDLVVGLDCPHVVLSLPRSSLSARRSYADDALALVEQACADGRYEPEAHIELGDELVCHLVRVAPPDDALSDTPRSDASPVTLREPGAVPTGAGRLVLVATPLGNLGDFTARAREALATADVVCAEDTRRTRKLLSAFDLHPPSLVSVRAQNEKRAGDRVVAWLSAGRTVAYVTDAGMPTVSDPGAELVRAVLDAGGQVDVVPGPDAPSTAVLLSGFAPGPWCFEGFLPVKGTARAHRLAALAAEQRVSVVFEAPHRLLRTLDDLARVCGPQRPVAVANDLTKRFERVWRGSLEDVRAQLGAGEPRGEFVVVVGPAGASRSGAGRTP